MLQRARILQDRLVAWRRTIHTHPELGFQEVQTAALVAGALREMDIHVETGIGANINVGTIIGNNAHIGPGALASGVILPEARIF